MKIILPTPFSHVLCLLPVRNLGCCVNFWENRARLTKLCDNLCWVVLYHASAVMDILSSRLLLCDCLLHWLHCYACRLTIRRVASFCVLGHSKVVQGPPVEGYPVQVGWQSRVLD